MAAIHEGDVARFVLKTLREKLELEGNRCYLVEREESERPDRDIMGSGDFVLQVCLGDMEAAQDEQGYDPETEEGVMVVRQKFTVSIFTVIQLDPSVRAEQMLLEIARGMLPYRKKVIRALAGTTNESNDFASRVLFERATKPGYDEQDGVSFQVLTFDLDYDLDLSADDDVGALSDDNEDLE